MIGLRPALGLTVALLLVTADADAWAPIHGTRPVWCETVPYSLNDAGSEDLGFSASESEVRKGMDDWTRVECSALRTDYRGTTSSSPGVYEGRSTIGWIESGWRHDSNAIGVTGPRWARCIVEADMELNGVHYAWTTEAGRGSFVNAFSIILHEGGHYYGLGHSSDPGASMYFAYRGGISPLAADDRAGICALYPGGGGVDCTVVGCPVGEECIEGACQPRVGDGSLCSPCQMGSDCGEADDFCLLYPDGAGYCGRACAGDSDCDDGFSCVSVEGAGQCIGVVGDRPSCAGSEPAGPECLNDSECPATQRCNSKGECEDRPTDREDLGAPCESDDGCNSQLCLVTPDGALCTQTCDWLDPKSCPRDFYCDGHATGSCGSGVCLAGSEGDGVLGGECAQDTDCDSLFCSFGQCALPCVPGAAGFCPDDFVCRVGSSGESCGACTTAASVGEDCVINSDCESLICASEGESSYCTDLCDDASGCPDGFTCEAAGDVSVCAPPLDSLGGDSDGGDDDGCGCRVPGAPRSEQRPWLPWIVLGIVAAVARRRRR